MRCLQLKILGIDHRIIWAFFIGMQSFIFSCMLGTFGSEAWVRLDKSYGGARFKGDLFEVKSSVDFEKDTYADLESY